MPSFSPCNHDLLSRVFNKGFSNYHYYVWILSVTISLFFTDVIGGGIIGILIACTIHYLYFEIQPEQEDATLHYLQKYSINIKERK